MVFCGFRAGNRNFVSNLGFSLSALLNGYLKSLIKTQTINFSLNQNENPSSYLINALKKSEEDRKVGRYKPYSSINKTIKYSVR